MNLDSLIKHKKKETVQENKLIIHLKKNGNKYVTSIDGVYNLSQKKDFLKETSHHLKKQLCCGSCIRDNMIELQGDHIEYIKKYLINEYKVDINNIIIKGK
jgi:translation initiation factor 1 (eIF-1/SUI1)